MLSSFERLFRERVTSPLFSTFIVTWILWNWKIFYLTLFISPELINPHNKIEFITVNYLNVCEGLIYPLISSGILLFVIPFGEKYVYKSYLYFRSERHKMKEKSESEKLLSIEESAAIRLEMLEQSDTHRRQLARKDEEIKVRDQQISTLRNERQRLKIYYAAYGNTKVPDKWKEVTQDVAKVVDANNVLRFTIGNNAFTVGDPSPGDLKDFFMVFEQAGTVKSFWAKENNSVRTEDNKTYLEEGSNRREIT
jgi:hypothetical protein